MSRLLFSAARKLSLAPAFLGVIAFLIASSLQPGAAIAAPAAQPSAENAAHFLELLFDPAVGLIRQYPQSQDYWLSPDNYLAERALAKRKAPVAAKIREALGRHRAAIPGKAGAAGPRAGLVFGEGGKPLPFRETRLVTVVRLGKKGRIRAEVASEKEVERWAEQADLLFLAALADAGRDKLLASSRFNKALRMWDGRGFMDKGVFHTQLYSAQALGLALLASVRLGRELPMRRELVEQLGRQQGTSGGVVRDYDKDGKAVGIPSAETTCVVLLALDAAP